MFGRSKQPKVAELIIQSTVLKRTIGIVIYLSMIGLAFLPDHMDNYPQLKLLMAFYFIIGSCIAFVLTFFPNGDGCPPGSGMQ